MKKVLVVVDMQNDFINGSLGTDEAKSIVPAVKNRIAEYIANGDPVLFTRDLHYDNYLETEEGKNLPVKHCIISSEGAKLCDDLYPEDYKAMMFYKDTFGSVDLGMYIGGEIRDGDGWTIEFVGLCTDVCVISNAIMIKAFCENAHIVVNSACCAGTTPEKHNAALEAMKAVQIEVI